jgi:hypothetical protein
LRYRTFGHCFRAVHLFPDSNSRAAEHHCQERKVWDPEKRVKETTPWRWTGSPPAFRMNNIWEEMTLWKKVGTVFAALFVGASGIAFMAARLQGG